MKPPEILFDLQSGKKSESNPHILKDDFRKMQSRYKIYQQIYTDGSKEDSKVGCAVISDNHSNMQRIPDDSSIFTAEAKAIDLALDFISTCDANNKFIIFSDLLSVLKVMNHWKKGKLHGITAMVINFLTSNQPLVNINQLFETLEEKK